MHPHPEMNWHIYLKLNVVQIFLLLDPYIPEFSDPQKPENGRLHSSNSYKNATS